jgi:SAM-dependent methyltransferase
VDDELTARGLSHTFSLARYSLHKEVLGLINQHAEGACLDSGSGRCPFRAWLERRCSAVTTTDVEDRVGQADLIADIQSMPGIEDSSFDTVLCTQVLEHVPRPWEALREMARVLRPGGKLILSVPHLSPIHEAPSDYYRYTRYGLEELCRQAGLELLQVGSAGGLLAFLAHGFSYVLLTLLWPIPGLRWIGWLFNYLLLVRLLEPLDRILGLRGLYPCNYVVLAQEPKGAGG